MLTLGFYLCITRRDTLANESVAVYATHADAWEAGRFYLTAPEFSPHYVRAIIRPCTVEVPDNAG